MSGDRTGSGKKRPRLIPPPPAAPGPLGDLKNLLYELYLRAEAPSLDEIAADIAADDDLSGSPGRDAIHRIIGSADLPPVQADVVAVATVLARRARWDAPDAADRAREAWVNAHMAGRHPPTRSGRPLAEVDPLVLGIHPAITSGLRTSRLELPPYITRTHDRSLAETVCQAEAGSSRLVVLVGGSSTGKSRACWEAVRELPEPWRLWHPIDARSLSAALDDPSAIGPHMVVWLNETQHYLLTPNVETGEQVAVGLRELLRIPSRGPVMILGTLWEKYWDRLTAVPIGADSDPHAQARALLKGTCIRLPESFVGLDLQAADRRSVETGDLRLAEALHEAPAGRLTQYLAGGPALIERYKNAEPSVRAVVEAAMDARRLGHGLMLPRRLLEEAAAGYLDEEQWMLLGEDWLDHAFAYLTDAKPCRGVRPPLCRVRPRAAAVPQLLDENRPFYQLADYIEQLGWKERQGSSIPDDMWNALVRNADPASLLKAAREAHQRSLYRWAFLLYTAAATPSADKSDTGAKIPHAVKLAADLLQETGREQEALDWLRMRARNGDNAALGWVTHLMNSTGQTAEAIEWLKELSKSGDHNALGTLTALLVGIERADEALAWIQERTQDGDHYTHRMAATMLLREGRTDEAILHFRKAVDLNAQANSGQLSEGVHAPELKADARQWLRVHAEATKDPFALQLMAAVLEQDKEIDVAFVYYLKVANTGDYLALWAAAVMFRAEERVDEAMECYRRLLAHRTKIIPLDVAQEGVITLKANGRDEQIVEWLQECAQNGDHGALQRVVFSLREQGRTDDAIIWLQARSEAGDVLAPRMAAQLLAEDGRIHDALTYYRLAGARGDSSAFHPLASLLETLGEVDEALTYYRQAATARSPLASGNMLSLLLKEHRIPEAIDWLYERALSSEGEPGAIERMVELGRMHGCIEYSTERIQALGEAGQLFAMDWTVGLLTEIHGSAAAISWLQTQAERGNIFALRSAADLLIKHDRVAEALQWLRELAEAGENFAVGAAAELMGNSATEIAVLDWIHTQVATHGHFALTEIANILSTQGNYAMALAYYLRAAEVGSPEAIQRACELLNDQGDTARAEHLHRYGIEPGGSMAISWKPS